MTKVRFDELKAALELRRPPAAKSEAAYKRELVAEINLLPGGRARRVEDKYAVGVLDLIIKLPDRPMILAEGKIIHGNLFGPTAAQFGEGKRWEAVGVPCVLLGWKHGQMYVSPWIMMADCRECLTLPTDSHVRVLQEYFN